MVGESEETSKREADCSVDRDVPGGRGDVPADQVIPEGRQGVLAKQDVPAGQGGRERGPERPNNNRTTQENIQTWCWAMISMRLVWCLSARRKCSSCTWFLNGHEGQRAKVITNCAFQAPV